MVKVSSEALDDAVAAKTANKEGIGQQKSSFECIETTSQEEAIPSAEMADGLCKSLGYDEHDREFLQKTLKRHETGEATRPERMLLHVALALVCPLPTKLIIANDWFELGIIAHESDLPSAGSLPAASDQRGSTLEIDDVTPRDPIEQLGLCPSCLGKRYVKCTRSLTYCNAKHCDCSGTEEACNHRGSRDGPCLERTT